MIKVSTLHSLLHEREELSISSQNFIKSIEKKINESIIFSDIGDYDCDLKLIFIETGGSEIFFKEKIDSLKEPYYFLTSGENNSLAATLEILTYLNDKNLKGEILHGSIDYISKRIKELNKYQSNLILNNKRYGVIGNPSDWLIASIPSYKEVKDKFGCELVDIDLKEITENFDTFSVSNINPYNYDLKEVEAAERVNVILENIVKKYKLDGLTIRCFDLLNSIHTTGCLSLAKLNTKGIIATCEGDIMAMLSMAIAKEISAQSSFQANPSRIDINTNEILFAHCTVPFDMLTSFKYKSHFESGIGVAIKGELKEIPVTVFRLSKNLKDSYIGLGKIIENKELENLCRTQVVVKMDDDVKVLLTNPSGNHHIIFYGDYTKELRKLFK